MGLFDFLRRKNGKPDALADVMEPRCAHYSFAHLCLRTVALENPMATLAALASSESDSFLESLLQSVDEHCQEAGREPADFSVDDLTVHKGRVGEYPCAILEMPAPQAITEAYFVALIVMLTQQDFTGDHPPENVDAAYYTLEFGASLDGEQRTVLCQWTESAHLNMGDGPPRRSTTLSNDWSPPSADSVTARPPDPLPPRAA